MKRSRAGLIPVLAVLGLATLLGAPALLAADTADEKPPAAPAGAVEVHLMEYAVKMPTTLPAGPMTFVLHNDGIKNHAFKVEGPGIEEAQSTIVEPRKVGELQVTLQPGEYKVYCPIGNHSAKGMSVKLTVTAKQEG